MCAVCRHLTGLTFWPLVWGYDYRIYPTTLLHSHNRFTKKQVFEWRAHSFVIASVAVIVNVVVVVVVDVVIIAVVKGIVLLASLTSAAFVIISEVNYSRFSVHVVCVHRPFSTNG